MEICSRYLISLPLLRFTQYTVSLSIAAFAVEKVDICSKMISGRHNCYYIDSVRDHAQHCTKISSRPCALLSSVQCTLSVYDLFSQIQPTHLRSWQNGSLAFLRKQPSFSSMRCCISLDQNLWAKAGRCAGETALSAVIC